jgi:hypothetical protein
MIDELSKALALSTQTVDTALGFITNLLGEPTKITGETLSDTLRNWQWKNRVKIASRASEITGKSHASSELMPKGFFLRFIDSSGNIDDEHLQEIWAQLLAESVSCHSQFHALLLNALESLGPEDAKLFNLVLQNSYRETSEQENGDSRDTRYGFAMELGLEVTDGLTRLEIIGLVRPCPSCLRRGSHIYVSSSNPHPHGDLTVLGAYLGKVIGAPEFPVKNKGFSTYW